MGCCIGGGLLVVLEGGVCDERGKRCKMVEEDEEMVAVIVEVMYERVRGMSGGRGTDGVLSCCRSMFFGARFWCSCLFRSGRQICLPEMRQEVS